MHGRLALGVAALALACGGSSGMPRTDGSTDSTANDGPVDGSPDGPGGDTGGAADVADGSGGGESGGEKMSADTWTTFARGFLETYCNTCHAPGASGVRGGALDFMMYDKVKAASAKIRCGTAPAMQSGCGSSPAPKQFPIGTGPRPIDAERTRLVAWIDAGLPI